MNNNFITALGHNIHFLDASAQIHMPDGLYRHFYQWAFTDVNQKREIWLQLIGLTQTVKMTAELLNDLVSDDHWYDLIQYSMVMNAYLVFETVSDNLGIGVIYPQHADLREHLTTFNDAMLARLENRKADWQLAMGKLATQMEVSGFAQSLSPQKYQQIASLYVMQHPSINMRDLEYSLFPSLVANIETCYVLYKQCDLLHGGAMVQAGLRARYESVNKLVNEPNMSLDERISASTDAILVAPVLGYYVAVLAECIYNLPNFDAVLASGHLDAALREASLIVRLLNDLGTLTRLSPQETDRLIDSIQQEAHPGETIMEVIIRAKIGTHITRLQKDAQHGEFNLALHGIGDQTVCERSLKDLSERLTYLRAVYKTSYNNLEKALFAVEQYEGHGFVRTLIHRFVRFHEMMYGNSYQAETGEYAV